MMDNLQKVLNRIRAKGWGFGLTPKYTLQGRASSMWRLRVFRGTGGDIVDVLAPTEDELALSADALVDSLDDLYGPSESQEVAGLADAEVVDGQLRLL